MEAIVEMDPREKGQRASPGARRVSRLFRVLVLGGVALAVACASAPHGPTGVPDENPSDGGGSPGW